MFPIQNAIAGHPAPGKRQRFHFPISGQNQQLPLSSSTKTHRECTWSIHDRPGQQHVGAAGCKLWGAGDHKTESPLDIFRRTSLAGLSRFAVPAGTQAANTLASLSPNSIFRYLNPFSDLALNGIARITGGVSARAGHQTSVLKCVSSLSGLFK